MKFNTNVYKAGFNRIEHMRDFSLFNNCVSALPENPCSPNSYFPF